MTKAIIASVCSILLLSSHSTDAAVEYVPLDAPCDGKEGVAIADYSWFAANALKREYVFTEVCVDLTRMRVFSVEDSDPFELAFKGPGQTEYHSVPPGQPDTYKETMTLITDVLVEGVTPDTLPDVADPEAPDSIAVFSWVKAGTARPLQRHGLASVWLKGFVGGDEPTEGDFIGEYRGWGEHMIQTYKEHAGLSGLGFGLHGPVVLDGTGGSVSSVPGDEVSLVKNAEISLSLHLDGNRISGAGSYTAENANLAPSNEQVWKSLEMTSSDLTGRVMGADGDKLYILAVFEGTYTNYAGEVLRATAAMTYYGERKPDTDAMTNERTSQTGPAD